MDGKKAFGLEERTYSILTNTTTKIKRYIIYEYIYFRKRYFNQRRSAALVLEVQNIDRYNFVCVDLNFTDLSLSLSHSHPESNIENGSVNYTTYISGIRYWKYFLNLPKKIQRSYSYISIAVRMYKKKIEIEKKNRNQGEK